MSYPYRFSRMILLLGLPLPLYACDEPVRTPPQDSDSSGSPTTTTETGSSPTPGLTDPPPVDSDPPGPGTSGGGASSGGSMDGASTAEAPRFDLGVPDMPPVDDECTKVDFLFIVDNSSSMQSYQANLVASFPGFIEGIQGVIESVDSYQVGVLTTDPYSFNVPGCQQLSSLVVRTGGTFSSNMDCGPYADGFNFMTENDDLATTFSCAAAVGTGGSGNEQPMQAMVEAVQRVEGGPGECNQGFIRDDALLVIVNIGDEFDNSPGTPMDWYDAVVEAKLGIPTNVVMVSFIDGPGSGCLSGEQSVQRSIYTELWGENGFEVPICAPDYAPFFQQAISIIDGACENYIPPAG